MGIFKLFTINKDNLDLNRWHKNKKKNYDIFCISDDKKKK